MTFKSWRKGGTSDFADWRPGLQVSCIQEVSVGDILFFDCEQFNALNLCRITAKDAERGICYATHCNPYNVLEGRNGGSSEREYAIWHHEFPQNSFGNRFLKASRELAATPEKKNLVKLYTTHGEMWIDTRQLASGRTLLTIYSSRGKRLKDVGRTEEIRMRAQYGVHRENLYATQELADADKDRILATMLSRLSSCVESQPAIA